MSKVKYAIKQPDIRMFNISTYGAHRMMGIIDSILSHLFTVYGNEYTKHCQVVYYMPVKV